VDPSITPQPPQSRHLDLAGGWASILCAIHCAVLPLLVAIVPGAGLDVLDNHDFDAYFAAFVILFGTIVIGTGYCPHRLKMVLAAFTVATISLLFGALDGDHGWRHAALLSIGGALMASAHLINRDGIRHHHCMRNPFRDGRVA
jgi:hypothetical protein